MGMACWNRDEYRSLEKSLRQSQEREARARTEAEEAMSRHLEFESQVMEANVANEEKLRNASTNFEEQYGEQRTRNLREVHDLQLKWQEAENSRIRAEQELSRVRIELENREKVLQAASCTSLCA